MVTKWQELKPDLVEALTDAFDESEFAKMLEFQCYQKLHLLVADRIPFPQKVYETVDIAERQGWLEELAKGSGHVNKTHVALQNVVSDLLAGIKAEGKDFYQQTLPEIEPSLEIEQTLLLQVKSFHNPMTLKILVASSLATKLSDGQSTIALSNEVALIHDLLQKLLMTSHNRKRFDVQLYEIDETGSYARRLESNLTYGTAAEPVANNLLDYDLILLLAWHNLGPNDIIPDIYQKARSEFQKANRQKQLIVLRRDEDPFPRPEGSTAVDPDYESVSKFFTAFSRDDSDAFKLYHPDLFRNVFELILREYLFRAITNHSRKERLLPRDEVDQQSAVDHPAFNPYKGLSPYHQGEGSLFFGRLDEVDHLRDRLANQSLGLLAVIGASGSGKSSLVRAGLLYRLALGAIPGSRDWKTIEISLSRRNEQGEYRAPLMAAAVAFHRSLFSVKEYEHAGSVHDELRKSPAAALEEYVRLLLPPEPANSRLLLFCDQFEEIFTLTSDPIKRQEFIDFIVHAASTKRIQVIITMRSDFYHRCLEYPELRELFKDGVYPLFAPAREAMRGIIVRPAIYHGFSFDNPRLPNAILDDAGSTSGSLPLVSYVLEQLTAKALDERRTVLFYDDYQQMGGVAGIIKKTADEAVQPFLDDPEFDKNFNAIFRELITVNDAGTATKKPAILADIPEKARPVVNALVEKRLLQTDESNLKPVVEIAHEALLRNWDRLIDWIGRTQSDRVTLNRVEAAARAWQEAREAIRADEPASELEAVIVDRKHLWQHDRLQDVEESLRNLGYAATSLHRDVQEFLRPEADRLVDELHVESVDHARRAEIGDRLAVIADKRPGIGLNEIGLPEFVWCKVPAGVVLLEIKTGRGDAGRVTVRKVVEAPFYISKYVVTVRQFLAFVGDFEKPQAAYRDEDETLGLWSLFEDGPSKLKGERDGRAEYEPYKLNKWWNHRPRIEPALTNYPAQYISWYQALAFAKWLTHQYRAMNRLNESQRIRIPTEWEWQQAAAGGNVEYKYPWGESWNPNYASNQLGLKRLVAVGMYPHGRSLVGAYDMSGNVYEWCLNAYSDLENLSETAFVTRTTRGGGYFTFPKALPVEDALSVFGRLEDKPDGTNERGDRIVASIRLVCDEPPKGALLEVNEELFK